jgi:hypothetical protein
VLSRGYYIGDIVDRLAELVHQVGFRNGIGLYDLSRICESFFCDLLNRICDYSLANANAERINAPGIDLLDAGRGIGFQITAQKSGAKINETLQAVSQLPQRPTALFVLVIGKKQTEYTTLNQHLCDQLGFNKDHVWDINDLCRQLLDLDLAKLQELHQLIQRDSARIRIELEVPDDQGCFATNVEDRFEQPPTAVIGNLAQFKRFYIEKYPDCIDQWESVVASLTAYVDKLKPLPRVTRELYGLILPLMDVSEPRVLCRINWQTLKRKCVNIHDWTGDIELLEAANLARIDEDEATSQYLEFRKRDFEIFYFELLEYLESKSVPLSRFFAQLNLSILDDPHEAAQPAVVNLNGV